VRIESCQEADAIARARVRSCGTHQDGSRKDLSHLLAVYAIVLLELLRNLRQTLDKVEDANAILERRRALDEAHHEPRNVRHALQEIVLRRTGKMSPRGGSARVWMD